MSYTLRRTVCYARVLHKTSKRQFSTPRMTLGSEGPIPEKIKVGYVPEHFSAPLHLAYNKFGLQECSELVQFPEGTGAMIKALNNQSVDVGIGLTEAWIVGLSNSSAPPNSKTSSWNEKPYHILGSYTQSPLTWAISTGGGRNDIHSVDQLKGKKVGISRNGSGSHIMSAVLAQQKGWLKEKGQLPFELVQCGPFASLREAVNSSKADFFMWEHFTSKKFFENGELKRIGEIETPWNAWHIAVRTNKFEEPIPGEKFLQRLSRGIEYFNSNKGEAVKFITETMEYSKEDAEAWFEGVEFASPKQLTSLDPQLIQKTIDILDTAGVLGDREFTSWKDVGAE